MTIDLSNSWPAELDAMIAAPDHHEVLLENDRVRVLVSLLKPGDSTPVHTHRWPAVLHILAPLNVTVTKSGAPGITLNRSITLFPPNHWVRAYHTEGNGAGRFG